jgi:hypothetical protein
MQELLKMNSAVPLFLFIKLQLLNLKMHNTELIVFQEKVTDIYTLVLEIQPLGP